jgi:hypothetical protein
MMRKLSGVAKVPIGFIDSTLSTKGFRDQGEVCFRYQDTLTAHIAFSPGLGD